MDISAMATDLYFVKFIQKVANMLARDLQARAKDMGPEELYENAEFLPLYDAELHNYNQKPDGYTCVSPEGAIMQLVRENSASVMSIDDTEVSSSESGPIWGYIWSSKPENAKPYIHSEFSPYNKGDYCLWNDDLYRSKIDANTDYPEEDSKTWERIIPEDMVG